jgi:parvulin-like peptidyl-prolyl isomerase
MRRAISFLLLGMALGSAASLLRAQELIDRIAARVEGDVILLSEIQELARYQLLMDGKSESDGQILNRLIDQWVVRNEANLARFPAPSDEDVERSMERLKRSFSSPEEFEARKKQSGFSDQELRHMLRSQLFLSNYLDARFRPSIQVADKDIENFYQTRVVPRAESRGQTAPTLDAARDYIQEALVQRAINEQADKWLKESRPRLRVENLLTEKGQ